MLSNQYFWSSTLFDMYSKNNFTLSLRRCLCAAEVCQEEETDICAFIMQSNKLNL